jgi:hypothetical protein
MSGIKDKVITAESLKYVRDKTYAETVLLSDDVPNTVQTYTFVDGSVSQILHKRNTTTIRTDALTYGDDSITEVRTLNTGEQLTIVTNLTTLETTVTYTVV